MENNIKRLLFKRAFAGFYTERRLVDEERSFYKDVVRLYPDEKELANDLAHASEVAAVSNKSSFGSYTADPPSIWVNPMDIPFGKHWFQITSVSFGPEGVCYWLKSLRYFPGVEYPTSKNYTGDQTEPITVENIKDMLQSIRNYILENLNINGLIGIIRFMAILVVALVTGLFKMAFFTGDFTLKLLHELRMLMDVGTPMFLGVLEFVSKIVGGFYILIAMIWKGSVGKNTRQDIYGKPQAIAYPKSYNR